MDCEKMAKYGQSSLLCLVSKKYKEKTIIFCNHKKMRENECMKLMLYRFSFLSNEHLRKNDQKSNLIFSVFFFLFPHIYFFFLRKKIKKFLSNWNINFSSWFLPIINPAAQKEMNFGRQVQNTRTPNIALPYNNTI